MKICLEDLSHKLVHSIATCSEIVPEQYSRGESSTSLVSILPLIHKPTKRRSPELYCLTDKLRRLKGNLKTTSWIMSLRRFLLFVKAASDGVKLGDCPFSQRVLMYAHLKIPESQLEQKTVDFKNKSQELLALNPSGSVPVLVDRGNGDKVITDSAEITKYIDEQFPDPDCRQSYDGPALSVTSAVFPKFAALIKNKDSSKVEHLKQDLHDALQKVDEYLKNCDQKGKYLLCDHLSEIDCMFMPRLRHVSVVAKHYHNFDISSEFSALRSYFENAKQNEVYQATCCPDEELIAGWSRHVSQ